MLEKLKKSYASIMGRLGDPLDDGTLYGPLHSKVIFLNSKFYSICLHHNYNFDFRLVSTATSKPLRTSRLLEETLSLEEISLKGCYLPITHFYHLFTLYHLGKAIMWSPQLLLVFPMIHLLFTGDDIHTCSDLTNLIEYLIF